MGFLLRLVSSFFLALGVIVAVIDAARSIAATAPLATPLVDAARSAGIDLEALLAGIAPAGAFADAWTSITVAILSGPAILVFAGLALIFYALGYRRRRDPRGALHA
ncbi:hypothetical protein [Aliihoeflea sp. 2WW]|uniref:hypothetical protein n=1 Tax=Aliihoeflea sp. 2WW TaxID=1381123 RepID=UPI000466CFF2|nr:hypothetical protein [Aliihoeflea sp. 2WW]